MSLSPLTAHSPDNLFLGFVVDKALTTEAHPPQVNEGNKPKGVLYAKDATYLQVSKISIMQQLSDLCPLEIA